MNIDTAAIEEGEEHCLKCHNHAWSISMRLKPFLLDLFGNVSYANRETVTAMGEDGPVKCRPVRVLPLSRNPDWPAFHGPIISPMVVTISALGGGVHIGALCSKNCAWYPNRIPFKNPILM